MKKETPSQAARKIIPEGFKSPTEYVACKHGALLGASEQWGGYQGDPKEHIVFREQKETEKLLKRIEAGDETAIFDFIRFPNDPEKLTHPFIVAAIRKWQHIAGTTTDEHQRYMLKEKLKDIGRCLCPDARGKSANSGVQWPPDIFNYYWEREWIWHHVLELFDSLPYRNWETRYREVAKKFKKYGLTKEYVKDRIESQKADKKMHAKYKAIARDETGDKFFIKPETVMKLLSTYK